MLTTESQIMNIRNTVWLIVFIGLGCLLFADGANANPFDAWRKVNKDLNSVDKTNQKIVEWSGSQIQNLSYINYQDMLDKLLKV